MRGQFEPRKFSDLDAFKSASQRVLGKLKMFMLDETITNDTKTQMCHDIERLLDGGAL